MLHYIAVNGRTGETMGSVPVQQWKLLLAALTVGTVLEAHRAVDHRELDMDSDGILLLLASGPPARSASTGRCIATTATPTSHTLSNARPLSRCWP